MPKGMDLNQGQGLQADEPQPCLVRRPSFRRSWWLGRQGLFRAQSRKSGLASFKGRADASRGCPLSSLCHRTGYCLRGTPNG